MKQAEYQKNDNVPVFLKGGTRDKILFYLTVSLAGLGVLGAFKFIWDKAQPPSMDEADEGKQNKLLASN